MTAKHKRNSANVLGVLLLSGLIGWLTGTAMLCRAKNPYVAIEDHGSLDFGTGDSSIDPWICPTDLPGQEGDPRRRFLSKSDHPRTWWGMDITSEGRISLGMGDSNRVNRASRTQSGIPENAWSHVAVVADRSNRQVRFYLNGQRDSVHELPADFTGTFNVPNDLTLGSTWQPFVGLLDEIRLFRRALGAAEIEAAYQRERGRRVSSEYSLVE